MNEDVFDITNYAHYFKNIDLEKYNQPNFDKNLSEEEKTILRIN